MGYARTRAIGLVGLAGHPVTVEAHVAPGLPALMLSGLPDASLYEARERVRAAVVNSGEDWPQRRITVNLLPADLPKRGSGFDLAIAAVLLAAAGLLPYGGLEAATFIGELGLDGRIRPVRGVLPMVVAAARAGLERVVVPNGQRGRGRSGAGCRGAAGRDATAGHRRGPWPGPAARATIHCGRGFVACGHWAR
jgi:magnesium chelatase family protein